MVAGIVVMILSGFLNGIIPVTLISEIVHLVFSKGRMRAPIIVCLSISAVLGIINTLHALKGSHGESGLVFVAFAPFLLVGFILAGLLLAKVYKWRGKPLLIRKEKGSIYNAALIALILFLLLLLFNVPNSIVWAGKVIEQESGIPVEGAVIVRSWKREISTAAGVSGFNPGIVESLSDEKGSFVVFGRLYFPGIPYLTWEGENRPVIFKAGYKLLILNKKSNVAELEKIPMNITLRKKELERAERNDIFDTHESILFKKITGRESDFIEYEKKIERKNLVDTTCQSVEKRMGLKKQKQVSTQSLVRDSEKNINQLISSLFKRDFIEHEDDIKRKGSIKDPYQGRREGARIRAHSYYTNPNRIPEQSSSSVRKLSNRDRAAEVLGMMDIKEPVHLAEIGRAVEAAIEEWGMNQNKFIVMSSSALGKLSPVSLPYLIAAMNDENTRVRTMAAAALGETGDERAVEPLLIALNDENKFVRRNAISSLLQLNDAAAIEPLIFKLTDQDKDVRIRVMDALRAMHKPTLDPFLEALNDRDRFMRQNIARVIIRSKCDKGFVDALIDAADNSDPVVLRNIALALGYQGDSRAVPSLIKLLQNDDQNVRMRAAEALGKTRSVMGLESLDSAMKDPSHWVRISAVEALGLIDDKRTINTLIEAWNDHDFEVRRLAAEVLVDKGDQAVEPLMRMLHHNEAYFRWRSAYVLAKIEDKRAVEGIRPLLNDNEPEVRYIALKALRKLGQQIH